MRSLHLSLALAAVLAATGCRGCKSCEDDELEEQEERDMQRDNFWRAQVTITGQGRVKTFIDAIDCAADDGGQHGRCGPQLFVFKEMAPPTMEAQPAPGWRFDHWDARVRDPDGGVHGRAGRMPDGKIYIDGFGWTDTGQLETVIAVFVPEGDAHVGVHP